MGMDERIEREPNLWCIRNEYMEWKFAVMMDSDFKWGPLLGLDGDQYLVSGVIILLLTVTSKSV